MTTTVLLADPALGRLADRFAERLPDDVRVVAVRGFDDEEFGRLAGDAEILVNARRPIGADALRLAPRTRLIQCIGVGIDAIDLEAARAAGVAVAYNPGVNRTGAAEHTLMLMLALIKRLPISEHVTRAGRFSPGDVIGAGIDDLADAIVGVVGMGEIGRTVAALVAAFGSRVVYASRRPNPEVDAALGARRLALDELLETANIVTLHVPLGPETHNLIGAEELARMRPGSWLVNCGRGGLVDEAALRDAVVSGHLAGAALDVLEHENDGTNPFADLPQVIVTPHVGGGSRNSMAGVVERSTANIRRFLAGEGLRDQVVP
ncbi:MAG TPA: NAD(P)-dependent oxidoreductase [Candidatus Limnocylindrales bacterium]|jgi:phosphoglycerate dehydrogenase-like enzyme